MQFQYCNMLVLNDCAEVACDILREISDFSIISEADINKFLLDMCQSGKISAFWKEKILDIFIEKNVKKLSAMEIKIEVLRQQEKYLGAINVSKALYEETHEIAIVHNMIAMVLNSCPNEISMYTEYIPLLETSLDSHNMIAAAGAYAQLGRIERAEQCGYNALLMLNGEDDFEVYQSFMSIHCALLNDSSNTDIEQNTVKCNSAVELRGKERTLYVCIENPADHIWKNGRNGCEAQHIDSTDSLYYKLIDQKVGSPSSFPII